MGFPGNIVAEHARVTCEEDAIVDWIEEADEGIMPTPAMEEEAREFAGYYTDNAALCIEDGPDTTECGQVIPEWAFI